MSKTFCPLPWIHLATRPNGDVRVCCTANASGAGIKDNKTAGLVKQDGVAMNLRDHTIEEVWNSEHMRRTRLQMLNNEIPESCRKCFHEESKGIVSKRQWETEVWNKRLDIDNIVAKTDEQGNIPVDIPYFDLRLGNVCNLKCVMCSPHDSSSWVKEWKLLYPKYTNEDLKLDQSWNENFDYTWYKKGTFLDSMKEQAKSIKELYFAGGEPLMIPEHYNILQFMVDEGYAKNCCVRYNSNGTVLEDRLFVLWSNFKEVTFNFSIDAYSKKNDYIRYPSEWNTIEKNLKILDESETNVRINIAAAVQLLNVPYLDELSDWKASQNFHKVNCMPFGGGLISTHLVYFPSYLNVRVLPKELKEFTKQRIENFIDRQKFNTEWMRSPMGKRRWEGLVDYMMAEDWTNKLPQLKDYLETLDKSRGTDFRKTFPKLGAYI
jgi:MoaA/NifB/PqqE/SkfB family radical SAM enzyme